MALLHRQYKTARTETRWHLQLKIRQMPIQTSASRGYVLFSSAIRDTHKSPKIVCWFADTVRGVSKLGKTRIIMNASLRLVRNTGFCGQNLPPYGYLELSVLSSSCNTAYPLKRHSRFICGLDSGIFLHNTCSGRLPFPHRSGGRSGRVPARWK